MSTKSKRYQETIGCRTSCEVGAFCCLIATKGARSKSCHQISKELRREDSAAD